MTAPHTGAVGLAIVGLDVRLGPYDGRLAFDRAVYAGSSGTGLPPSAAGADPIGALATQLAASALGDAGVRPGERVAIVAGAEESAERIARAWQLEGPRIALPPAEMARFEALTRASEVLAAGEADRALLIVIELNDADATTTETARANLSHDRAAEPPARSGGGVALVVMPEAAARARGAHVYAVVESLAMATWRDGDTAAVVAEVAARALAAPSVAAGEVEYLELHASGVPEVDRDEAAGLTQTYRGEAPIAALGSARATVGDIGALGWAASLTRAAICLDGRYLPGTPGWTAPRDPEAWRGGAVYVPGESRPWLRLRGVRRHAAVQTMDADGCAHLVLKDGGESARRPAPYRPTSGLMLLPLTADDGAGLIGQLDEVETELRAAMEPARLGARLHADGQLTTGYLGLALVGGSRDELLNEVAVARAAVASTIANRGEWATPRGSCMSGRPVGVQGRVAFVYPGAFAAYPGVARGALRLFPSAVEGLIDLTHDLEAAFATQRLYPRTTTRPGARDLAAFEAELAGHPIEVITAGITTATLYTRALRQVFQIEPAAALGYSLGEVAMLVALGVWTNGDALMATMNGSPLFRSRLTGPMAAVREYWARQGLEIAPDEPPWGAYVVLTDAARVLAAIPRGAPIFLTIVNSPGEVVIAGYPSACLRLIERLGCDHVPMPFGQALHAPPLESEQAEFARINRHVTTAVEGIAFYSAASDQPLALESENLAEQIAAMACHRFDFAGLVERVYGDGGRVFVEVGAASTCSRLIDATLAGRDHLAVSINRRGADDQAMLVRLLARLHAHRVPMNLSPLYAEPTGAA